MQKIHTIVYTHIYIYETIHKKIIYTYIKYVLHKSVFNTF